MRALLLCSNNYLGLANHPALAAAAARAARDAAASAPAHRASISGSLAIHRDLETRLARFKHTESAVLFPTGYHANIGADHRRSSERRRRLQRPPEPREHHRRLPPLRRRACTSIRTATRARSTTSSPATRRGAGWSSPTPSSAWTATTPRSAKSRAVAARHDAMLMVDEAHATGVEGPTGAGLVEAPRHRRRRDRPDGNARQGARRPPARSSPAAGRSIELLVNRARSLIYTTALPPPVVAAVDAALDIVEREPERRAAPRRALRDAPRAPARARLRDPAGRGPDHPRDRRQRASARARLVARVSSSAASSCKRSARRRCPTAPPALRVDADGDPQRRGRGARRRLLQPPLARLA